VGCCSALCNVGALCERNNRVFESREVTSLEIKSRFLRSLSQWMSYINSLGVSSFEEFLDSCNLS
jgi:hypothetical protein